MRSSILFGALLPIVFACDNPLNDACASAMTASSADAATFCATYTAASNTVSTGLPAYATYCSNEPKKVSSACSCLAPAAATSVVSAVENSSSSYIATAYSSSAYTTFQTSTIAISYVSFRSLTPSPFTCH